MSASSKAYYERKYLETREELAAVLRSVQGDGDLPRFSVAEVVWLDSAQLERGEWMLLDDVARHMDDLKQRSIGYIVAESDISISLARSVSEWELDSVEKVEGVLCIPKASIVSKRIVLAALDEALS